MFDPKEEYDTKQLIAAYKQHMQSVNLRELFTTWAKKCSQYYKLTDNLGIPSKQALQTISYRLSNALKHINVYKKFTISAEIIFQYSMTLRDILSMTRNYSTEDNTLKTSISDQVNAIINYFDDDDSVDVKIDENELKKFIQYNEKSIRHSIEDEIVDGMMDELLYSLQSKDTLEKVLSKYKNVDDGPLGHYAFPNQRISIGHSIETDTKFEENLSDELESHFHNNKPIGEYYIDFMQSALKSGQYKDIFTAPDTDTIYRGMQLDDKHVQLFLMNTGMTAREAHQELQFLREDDEPPWIKGKPIKYDVTMMYRHREGVSASSWTTDRKQAIKFADERGDHSYKMTWGIVLHASVSKNKDKLLSGPDGLYDLTYAYEYNEEAEVLALDNIYVHKIELGLMTPMDVDRDLD